MQDTDNASVIKSYFYLFIMISLPSMSLHPHVNSIPYLTVGNSRLDSTGSSMGIMLVVWGGMYSNGRRDSNFKS